MFRGVKSADEVEVYINAEGEGLRTLKRFGQSYFKVSTVPCVVIPNVICLERDLPQILGSSVIDLDNPSAEGVVRAEVEIGKSLAQWHRRVSLIRQILWEGSGSH